MSWGEGGPHRYTQISILTQPGNKKGDKEGGRHGQLIVADQKKPQQQLVTVGFFNPSIDFLPLILFQHFQEDTFPVYPGWNIPKTPQLRGNPVSTRT